MNQTALSILLAAGFLQAQSAIASEPSAKKIMSHTPRVAIVEAGFGGLGLAEQLDHVIKADLPNHKENI